MLNITAKSNNSNTINLIWYIGQELEVFKTGAFYLNGIRPEHIESIQADGHELEFLKETVVHLPYTRKARVVEWHGDMAKLIFQAIPKSYSR